MPTKILSHAAELLSTFYYSDFKLSFTFIDSKVQFPLVTFAAVKGLFNKTSIELTMGSFVKPILFDNIEANSNLHWFIPFLSPQTSLKLLLAVM